MNKAQLEMRETDLEEGRFQLEVSDGIKVVTEPGISK